MRFNKKILLITIFSAAIVAGQSFAQKHDDDDEKPKNLKVLPKNITGRELHNIMRGYSMSLGVRCNFCHVAEKVEGQEKPKYDFASDNKQEKKIAREMMRMTTAINENYLGKMIGGDHELEKISCVTCHMGHKTPNISLDSLKKEPAPQKKD